MVEKTPTHSQTVSLVVRRTIRASAARLFEAWTQPAQLLAWWGPKHVRCSGADVDLRVGGAYRIANELPDGRTLVIDGEFEVVEPPHKLVYTWRLGSGAAPAERVTVRFEPRHGETEVIVIHERIADTTTRDGHELGWHGCLDGLAAHIENA
jgi:uncharacterized protein YndB with AHSA1/START domain